MHPGNGTAHTSFRRMAAASLLLAATGPATGQAQQATEIPDVVVTATREARPTPTIPANVTVLTSEELSRVTARTVPDVLKHLAGITVSEFTGNGRTTTVDIRGFGETAGANVLVLVDGRRINNADLSDVDWTTIPLERIDRIEIVRGGGSVLYGDKAVAGIINIRTKGGTEETTVEAEVSFGSFGYAQQSLRLSGSTGPFSYAIDEFYSSTNGYRANSEFRSKGAGLRLDYDNGGWFRWDLSAGVKEDAYGLPGALPEGADRESTFSPHDHAETADRYAQWSPEFILGPNDKLNLDFSHRELQSRAYFDFGGGFTSVSEFRLTESTAGIRYDKQLRTGRIPHDITVGVDYAAADDHYIHDPFGNGDLYRREVGYYAYDNAALIPEELFLDIGYRRTRISYDYDNFSDGAFSVNSGRIGLTWQILDNSRLFASYDRAFRTLRLDEVFGNFSPLPPQISQHAQAGVEHSFTDWLTASATVFRIESKDEIFYNPLLMRNANYERTLRRGVELELTADPVDWMRLFANYTWIDARLKDGPFDGNEVPGVPRHSGSFGASWFPFSGLTADVRARWAKNRHPISDFGNVVGSWDDSFFVVDAKLTYDWSPFTFYVGVENLLDKEYSETGVYNSFQGLRIYPSPERNVVAGIRLTKTF